ncbi:MAG: DUF433 domain-containing protein [Phycisphaerales bacterium]|nr:DUF433 domain-containing protein [Phycisphaerales bacterium]MCI0631294.1 DUF433 domain-containing protein [Phycisphaerales bacterium]MCI0677313.1 DUF433 domain-containing protein [Phycisphaerales bacterium]
MRWQDHIERNPKVMLGKPVVKGTRITVELILERLGGGWNPDDLLKSYPHIRMEDIRAALLYASKSLSTDEVVFLEDSA